MRDDLIHREIPSNEWRKLKYNLAAATDQGHHTLLTFGGDRGSRPPRQARLACPDGARTAEPGDQGYAQ